MSALIIGGEEPLGAQLASRLQRLDIEVAATLPPGEGYLSHAHALTRRGVEVFFCDPLDPIALSSALMGRDEVYLCLTPHLEHAHSLLTTHNTQPSPSLPPSQLPSQLNQSPLSALLESCAIATPTLPHITLLCPALALPALSDERAGGLLCSASQLTQEARARLMSDDPLCLTTTSAQEEPKLSWGQRLASRFIALTLPTLDREHPSWRQARRALIEASALELTVVIYALPYHEGRLLSEAGGIELLSWLKPHVAPFAPLTSLVTGLISLRAARIRRGTNEVKGLWGLGGDNIRLHTLELLLALELTPTQRRATQEGLKKGLKSSKGAWPLSSWRAERVLGYAHNTGAPTIKPAS